MAACGQLLLRLAEENHRDLNQKVYCVYSCGARSWKLWFPWRWAVLTSWWLFEVRKLLHCYVTYKCCNFCSETFQAFDKPNFDIICWLKLTFDIPWIYALLSTSKNLMSKSFTCISITKWKFSYFSVPVWLSLSFYFHWNCAPNLGGSGNSFLWILVLPVVLQILLKLQYTGWI